MTEQLQTKLNEVKDSLADVRALGVPSVEPILHGIDTLILSVLGVDSEYKRVTEANLLNSLDESLEILKKVKTLALLEKKEKLSQKSKWKFK